jgi:hypothetical protein
VKVELAPKIQDCLPFGSADFTESTSLSSACGKELQLRA